MNMILEIFQVQNEFSLMDGNSYLSFQKKQIKKIREMNLQWEKHLPL